MNITFEKKMRGYHRIIKDKVEVGFCYIANEVPRHLDLFLNTSQMKIIEEYNGKYAYLDEIRIKPIYRKKGYFKHIMKALHSFLLKEGYESVILIPMPLMDEDEKLDMGVRWNILIQAYKKLSYGIMASYYSNIDCIGVGVVLKKELRE